MDQPTYHIKTFGCQMNKSDSERIATVMDAANYQPALLKEAGLVIFNTCSVRQMAEDRAVGQIMVAKKRGQQVVVTGCLKNQDDFTPKHSEVDLFIDIHDIAELPAKLGKPTPIQAEDYFSIAPKNDSPAQAFVPIMTGCNNFCSYCIVPHVRGQEKSREPESIIKEIKALIAKGCRQITLLGQNVNSYKSGSMNFPILLEKIAKLPGDFRVFFVTSHPKDLKFTIIDLVAKYDKLCPYFHLPIQSGSDKILKEMNRKYTRQEYLKIIEKIRQTIPNAAISTDIIVGYPGETTEDFEQSTDLCHKIKYDQAYIARFSPRPMTKAAKVKDDIPQKTKKEREKTLSTIVEQTALAKNEKLVGQTTNVLVEKSTSQDGDYANFGKNELFKTVKFVSPENCQDKMVPVKIIEALPWGLKGEMTNEQT